MTEQLITIKINGKKFCFAYSKIDYYAKKAADSIKIWINDQKDLLPEDRYLQLLCNYQTWLKNEELH